MNKSKYRAKTLDDPNVLEGLCAVSQLEKHSFSSGNFFVVGGVATQSYLPSSCRRETADIDLAIMIPLTYRDFKTFSKPVSECLSDLGYLVEEKKGHNNYMLLYMEDLPNKQTNANTGVIEFARRSKNNMVRIYDRLEREFANTRVKRVEGRSEKYRVSSPEDIVSPKLVRGIRALRDNPDLKKYLQGAFPITPKTIERDIAHICNLRQEVKLLEGDLEIASRLRFASDIYDIKVLSELTGFNEDYLKESILSWDCLKEKTSERTVLIKNLFPFLNI